MGSFEDKLARALALHHPIPDRPRLKGRPAAVLILFRNTGEDPELLLTQRTETLETHKGQVAFPGGAIDPDDVESCDQGGVVIAALRETEEEVGVPRDQVRVLGILPELWTPTGFLITPVVGVHASEPESLVLRPNPAEIAATFWAPLSLLQAPETYRLEQYLVQDRQVPIHVYQVHAHRVWGATGAIIKNLLDRLQLCEERQS